MKLGDTNTGGGTLTFGPFPAGTIFTFFNCEHASTTQTSVFTLTVGGDVLCVDSLPLTQARPWYTMVRGGLITFDVTAFDPASKFSVFISIKYPDHH